MRRGIIIRSAPMDMFEKVLHECQRRYPDIEWSGIFQESLKGKEQNYPMLKRVYFVPDCQLTRKNFPAVLYDTLREMRPYVFIIPSNNPLFVGYSGIISIAMGLRARKVVLMDKDGKKCNVSKILVTVQKLMSAVVLFFKNYDQYIRRVRTLPLVLSGRVIEGDLPYDHVVVGRQFANIGLIPKPYYIQVKQFEEYVTKANYDKKKYLFYGEEIFLEKALEHFVSLQFVDRLTEASKVIDIASAGSPIPEIIHRLYGSQVFSNDLSYPVGITRLNDYHVRFGCSACSMPVDNAVFDLMLLHCSFEMFEGNDDGMLIKEAERVLKRNGKLVIIPLYMNEVHHILRDPMTKQRPLPLIDEGAKIVYRKNYYGISFARFYSVEAFQKRVLSGCTSMSVEIFDVQNSRDIHPKCYLKWIAVFTKK